MEVKNSLPDLVNYEKATFWRKQIIWKCDRTAVNLEKTLEYLKSKKAYDLKISHSEYLEMFSYTPKYTFFLYSKIYSTNAK